MTIEDKIMYLESATRVHFVPYQWVDDGLLEYFEMLRRGENDKFLDDLHTIEDIWEYAITVRDIHMQPKDKNLEEKVKLNKTNRFMNFFKRKKQ
jgi:hypothetical protein